MLRSNAEMVWPLEACGLLLGIIKGKKGEVKEVKIVPNVDKSSVRFQVEPETLYKIYNEASAKSMDIIGIFHSHPAPPLPSGIDLHFMEINPVCWVIMSMPGGMMKAYVQEKGDLQEVKIAERLS
jgi:proteasome lid subunit RPN8/RPN11